MSERIERKRQPETGVVNRSYAEASWWPTPVHESRIARFDPIGLEQMGSMSLMDRHETKYVFPERRLDAILAALTDAYRVLDVNETRLNHYRTLYFDTPDFALFRRHQAGSRHRYKVRSRSYLDSGLSFLEIKYKVKRNRTVKRRMETVDFAERLSPDVAGFLDTCLPGNVDALEPKLWNEYTRITLANLDNPERVTIDLNLQFRGGGETIILPGVIIAEMKRASGRDDSPFVRLMKTEHLRPTGFSKYCIGVSMLYPEVKHNHFKSKLQMVSTIIREENQYVF